ncbi:MAG TPA: hypothetical protein PKY09_11880 [Bacteroidia bacterium]|nr:hypothetical protein [Bacteroidia bacterium]HNJ61665.1 hypothetical protein [Chitinophagales bacterium]HNL03673.1 hypothetical protein [Bacteroidia bacterium]HNO81622.1 hypothetical protein [Bacteroidia bacterium]
MRKYFTLLLVVLYSNTFAQKIKVDAQMIQMGWTFVSPLILKKINDPLTKEIISKTVPKLINQDAKGAAYEVSDAIYRIKNVKVLNKEFLSQVEKSITDGVKAINRKDYASAVNGLVKTVAFSEAYIKKGILDQPTPPTQVTNASINAVKTDIVTAKEINEKLHLGKNNDYLFFIPTGNFTQKETTEKENLFAEDFNVNIDSEKKFNMGVGRQISSDLQNVSVERFQTDKNASDKLKETMADILSKSLGEGQIIKSEIATYPNFKSLKYTYLYTDKETSTSSMAYVLITFQDTSMFIIYFNTPANDFLETSKSFEDLMRTFFIIGIDEISNANSKTYSKAVITKIAINKIPSIKSTGEPWDNPFGNNLPDIYYIITDKNGQILRSLNPMERKEDVNPQNLPVYFSLTGKGFVLDDLKETIFIFLYDYDSVTDPDKVGSVGFKLSDYMFGKDAYKEQITKANGNTEISISVKWE